MASVQSSSALVDWAVAVAMNVEVCTMTGKVGSAAISNTCSCASTSYSFSVADDDADEEEAELDALDFDQKPKRWKNEEEDMMMI